MSLSFPLRTSPDDERDGYRARLTRLEPDDLHVTGAVAVWGGPIDLPTLAALTDAADEVLLPAVDRAIEHEILVRTDGGDLLATVDVLGPALRGTLVDELPLTVRSALHLRAAELVPDTATATVHRLAGATRRDGALAREAVRVALEQFARGEPAVACRLLQATASICETAAQRSEALLLAVDVLLSVGDEDAARRTLAEACPDEAPPAEAGAAYALALGHLTAFEGDPRRASTLLMAAWRAAPFPALAARAAALLALAGVATGDLDAVAQWSERSNGAPGEGDARLGHAILELSSGSLERASEALRRIVTDADRHPTLTIATARCSLVESLYRRGQWNAALDAARDLHAMGDAVSTHAQGVAFITEASIAAHRGDYAQAEALLCDVRARLQAAPVVPGMQWVDIGEAGLAAARGDAEGVVAVLLPLLDDAEAVAGPEGIAPWRSELIDALLAVGRRSEAHHVQRCLEPHLVAAGAHARCGAARATALLAVSDGALSAARAAFDSPEATDETAGVFMRARLELAAGSWLRRRGLRRQAAQRLKLASDGFASLRAIPWHERARRERDLCGGVADESRDGLTAGEWEVANLVAAGRTNRETATCLGISIKTVEAHLSRIYTKLGINRRAELAAQWRRRAEGASRET